MHFEPGPRVRTSCSIKKPCESRRISTNVTNTFKENRLIPAGTGTAIFTGSGDKDTLFVVLEDARSLDY